LVVFDEKGIKDLLFLKKKKQKDFCFLGCRPGVARTRRRAAQRLAEIQRTDVACETPRTPRWREIRAPSANIAQLHLLVVLAAKAKGGVTRTAGTSPSVTAAITPPCLREDNYAYRAANFRD
jgi:hypothetical protein